MIRLAIRGYAGRPVQFEERMELEEPGLEDVVGQMAEAHAGAMAAGLLNMIEIEFLDEPDPNERFFRIGTSPSGMVMPIEVNL